MGNNNEYVFCPHCGGITIPGICVNCGMRTTEEKPVEEHLQPYVVTESFDTPAKATNYQYQQPNMSYTVNPPKKKSHWWLWLIIIGVVLFFGVFLLVLVGIVALIMFGANDSSTASVIPSYEISSMPEVTVPDTPDIPDAYDTTSVTICERDLGRLDFSDFDWDSYANTAMIYSDTSDGSNDLFLNREYLSTFGSNHDNHSISEFSGDYFEPFVDCIDTSYDYRLSRHFIDYSNLDEGVMVNAKIAYIQFEGDTIPNEDALNQQILEMTANDLWGYLDGQKPFYSYYSNVTYMIDSYIPYNDGEKMSILLDVNVYDGEYREDHHVYAINIDLVNGEIMDNGSILQIDEDFAAMFRERNDAQNGTDVLGVISLDDSELAEMLSSANTNIVFFSPYGMEVGYNYESTEYSWGWVTITLSDYEDYLQ